MVYLVGEQAFVWSVGDAQKLYSGKVDCPFCRQSKHLQLKKN